MMHRREFVRFAVAAGAGTFAFPRLAASPTMTVYKSPTCGCCKEWVKHVEAAGFAVKTVDLASLDEIKRTSNVPVALQSCHTALVGTYVVEGHVPADLVKKMLAEKPAIVGLAVPGMVTGSPGMEMGNTKDPYQVIAFDRAGKTQVYAQR
jgi:hypothetical protein